MYPRFIEDFLQPQTFLVVFLEVLFKLIYLNGAFLHFGLLSRHLFFETLRDCLKVFLGLSDLLVNVPLVMSHLPFVHFIEHFLLSVKKLHEKGGDLRRVLLIQGL